MREAEKFRGSNQARIEAIRVAVAAVRQRPLLGLGPSFRKASREAELGHPNYIDNTYLAIVIELGIAGLVAFLFLIAGVLRRILPFGSVVGASQGIAFARSWRSVSWPRTSRRARAMRCSGSSRDWP